MARPFERVLAVLSYTGAIRLPLGLWWVPDWLYTVPPGLLLASLLWIGARRRSPFVAHHARAGLLWAIQVNGLLLALSLLAEVWYRAWYHTGVPLWNQVWHLNAELFRWAAALGTLLTALAMFRAAKGQTGDPLGLPSPSLVRGHDVHLESSEEGRY
ncbi:MAG: hypothetical protein LOD90_04350 [Symbiobacteriaceae bacterium]|nr:MAG: hypothetical protein DIU55_09665 [Bacillota bacterium]